jgi:hypothetical protein
MIVTRIAGRAGALLIPIALAVAACSGGTSSSAPSAAGSNGAAPFPSIVLPSFPDFTSGLPAVASGEPTLGIAIPSFDLGQLSNGLAKVDSYQIAITVKGADFYKGTVMNKPVAAKDVTLNGATHIVVIGSDAWVGQAGGELKSTPGTMAAGLFTAYDPTLLVAAFSGPVWAESAANKGTEQKNGVNTTHYRIDGSTLANGFSGLPAGATIDSWISDTGSVIALETSGWPTGDLSIQVTNIDDPANKVDRPS